MIYSPEETEDARRNPRVGDVWSRQNGKWFRLRRLIETTDGIFYEIVHGNSCCHRISFPRPSWLRRTRNATLIKKGEE
jgi:hypothetical protein